MNTESKRTRRTPAEQAAFHRDEMNRHARKAFIAERQWLRDALALAKECEGIASSLPGEREELSEALADAYNSISTACETLITAALSKSGESETKQ